MKNKKILRDIFLKYKEMYIVLVFQVLKKNIKIKQAIRSNDFSNKTKDLRQKRDDDVNIR